jgi:hypothetical protein
MRPGAVGLVRSTFWNLPFHAGADCLTVGFRTQMSGGNGCYFRGAGFWTMWEGLWHRSRASCRAARAAAYLNWNKRQRALPQKSEINLAGRLTNAALITVSAERLGIRVRTDNERVAGHPMIR